ncbi:hypothetical protein ACFXPA_34830 [Amycolatopsis sp. NPDC059090]|uniref:hypothetical protein n=1 Tax=unclassified Amycolatopsis TaxID=2618356 RepID=UPI0036732D99
MPTNMRRSWFYLDIATGDAEDAGTDGPVHVRLSDDRGAETVEQVLGRAQHDRLRRATTDRRFVAVPAGFARPVRLAVRLAGDGRWLLAEALVTGADGSTRFTTGRRDTWIEGGTGETVFPLHEVSAAHLDQRREPRHRTRDRPEAGQPHPPTAGGRAGRRA